MHTIKNKFIKILCFFTLIGVSVESETIHLNPPVDSFDIYLELQQKMAEAINAGDTKKLSKYLNHYDVNKRTVIDGSTLLMEAIYAKKINVVEFLLDEDADPNLRSAPFYDEHDNLILEDSPLEAAIVFDTLFSIADLLINNGANVNDTDLHYGTALSQLFNSKGEALQDENIIVKKAKWLIKNGANVNAPDKFGQPPLYHAGYRNLKNAAMLLLESGARADIKSRDGETLLYRLEDADLAKLYIKMGADVNAQSDDGLTALHHSIFSDNVEIAKLLIENGANVNLRDFDSRLTPLDWITIEIGVYSTEITKLLIKNGASIDYALARNYGAEEILKGIERDAR